jgi:hypothetical protein
MRRALTFVALLGLSSCATTIGRIPFPAPGEGRTFVMLDATKDVKFATDFEVRYRGDVHAEYEIELLQGGDVVAKATCNPLTSGRQRNQCMSRRLETGYHHYSHCPMSCVAELPKSGMTEIRATLLHRWTRRRAQAGSGRFDRRAVMRGRGKMPRCGSSQS